VKRTASAGAGSDVKAPSLGLLALEGRIVLELPYFMLRSQWLDGLPRGDGHAVLVIPGFGFGDLATAPLRSALRRLGYDALGWGLGRNLGMRPSIKNGLAALLEDLADKHRGPVSLIGWSLGGVYAREMARHQPGHVRRVITLGSPINVDPDANNLTSLFRLVNRGQPIKLDRQGFDRRRQPPPVSCVAMHTLTDGIVAWPCSVEDEAANTANHKVHGSHLGLVFNHEVLRVLAYELAKPADIVPALESAAVPPRRTRRKRPLQEKQGLEKQEGQP